MTRPVVAVAYSGGRDSTALLHATMAAAESLEVDVAALHVHHGLSANADDWLRHCEAQCLRWAGASGRLSFASVRVASRPARGDSVEAWARTERYRALRAMALERGGSLVLLGHHRRDQAETFLLQALRGAGMAGLAGMPRLVERDGLSWARPWLAVPRESIEAYVQAHRLEYIEDDGNRDTALARNRLRHEVWPALLGAFPEAEGSFAAAATWSHEAGSLLAQIGAADLAASGSGSALKLSAWRALSPERRSNALRRWLRENVGRPATARLTTRLLDELMLPRGATWQVPGGDLRSQRGELRFIAHTAAGMASGGAVLDHRGNPRPVDPGRLGDTDHAN